MHFIFTYIICLYLKIIHSCCFFFFLFYLYYNNKVGKIIFLFLFFLINIDAILKFKNIMNYFKKKIKLEINIFIIMIKL